MIVEEERVEHVMTRILRRKQCIHVFTEGVDLVGQATYHHNCTPATRTLASSHMMPTCSSHDLSFLLPLVESDGEGEEGGEHCIQVTAVTIIRDQPMYI